MWKEKHLEGGREENYRLSEDEMDRREGYESVTKKHLEGGRELSVERG